MSAFASSGHNTEDAYRRFVPIGDLSRRSKTHQEMQLLGTPPAGSRRFPVLPLRGAGITRTALDISSSERALRLAGLRTLRILARRNRELANFQNLIAQQLQVLVLFAALPLLDFVYRLPAGDDHTLGSFARKAGDDAMPCWWRRRQSPPRRPCATGSYRLPFFARRAVGRHVGVVFT